MDQPPVPKFQKPGFDRMKKLASHVCLVALTLLVVATVRAASDPIPFPSPTEEAQAERDEGMQESNQWHENDGEGQEWEWAGENFIYEGEVKSEAAEWAVHEMVEDGFLTESHAKEGAKEWWKNDRESPLNREP
ncbi:hypothetical protein Pla86_49030 [Planctomycetes bacterium Pla86]|uniref:Uncharacterized protein n=2 Tax=Engelhardtia mirabilis TaxID=2528011 RepID=A0A518BS37_9BACT|nr:hypothetical protein Pla133_49050 [Planctomycetes bacterium Pla133]QDV04109.1 hypothetical protein Pla86_49030 [Planctomycetes bacterium Pla86]